MDSKDKEAFDKWWQDIYDSCMEFRDWQGCDITFDKKEDMRIGWQAGCEHKQKEIDELRKINNRLSYQLKESSDEIEVWENNYNELQEQNTKLKEALEFYADTNNWDAAEGVHDSVISGVITGADHYEPRGEVGISVGGKLARQVLKQLFGKTE